MHSRNFSISQISLPNFGIFFQIFPGKETVSRLKKQPKEQQKIFTIHVLDSELISKIQKYLRKLNPEIKKNPIDKQTSEMHRHFPKDQVQWPIDTLKKLNIPKLWGNAK